MKLVFIYGPPASGKLTVARELATLTGYRLFHNHLIVDAVAAVSLLRAIALLDFAKRFG